MRALLVRVGADVTETGGGWNGPVSPKAREFVYVPILEKCRQHRRMRRPFTLAYTRFNPLCIGIDPAFAARGDASRSGLRRINVWRFRRTSEADPTEA